MMMSMVSCASLLLPSPPALLQCTATPSSSSSSVPAPRSLSLLALPPFSSPWRTTTNLRLLRTRRSGTGWGGSSAQLEPLDLTEDNVEQVLLDARSELLQLFDTSVGITGVAELVELDGPFVKLRLTGRFWHERSMVLARLANYLQKRIPEIVEVEIEDESQLDDSAANF